MTILTANDAHTLLSGAAMDTRKYWIATYQDSYGDRVSASVGTEHSHNRAGAKVAAHRAAYGDTVVDLYLTDLAPSMSGTASLETRVATYHEDLVVDGDYVVAPRAAFDSSSRGMTLAVERSTIGAVRGDLPLIEVIDREAEQTTLHAHLIWDSRLRQSLRRTTLATASSISEQSPARTWWYASQGMVAA